MAEVESMSFERVLSDDERRATEQYLLDRWPSFRDNDVTVPGQSQSVPGTHIYASQRPLYFAHEEPADMQTAPGYAQVNYPGHPSMLSPDGAPPPPSVLVRLRELLVILNEQSMALSEIDGSIPNKPDDPAGDGILQTLAHLFALSTANVERTRRVAELVGRL